MVIKGESMPTPCKIAKLNRKERSSEGGPEFYSGYSDGRKYMNREISDQATLIQAPKSDRK